MAVRELHPLAGFWRLDPGQGTTAGLLNFKRLAPEAGFVNF